MFRASHVDYDVIQTQRQGHATEIASQLDLDRYDAIVTVSGDGLLHEVFNGLMKHVAWQRAIKCPIGVIPGGTGNGLVVSCGIWGAFNPHSRHYNRIMPCRAEACGAEHH